MLTGCVFALSSSHALCLSRICSLFERTQSDFSLALSLLRSITLWWSIVQNLIFTRAGLCVKLTRTYRPLHSRRHYSVAKNVFAYIGKSVPTSNDGSLVTFAVREGVPFAQERTNERHDLLLQQLRINETILAGHTNRRGRKALAERLKATQNGVQGFCILRSLSTFDVGRSFLVDSLHNVYLGLYVSMTDVVLICYYWWESS